MPGRSERDQSLRRGGPRSRGRRRLQAGAAIAVLLALGVWTGTASAKRAVAFSLRSDALAAPEVMSVPKVEVEAATEVHKTSAILNAVVNPEGSEVTECYFEWGTSPSLGQKTQCTNLPGSGTSGIPVYAAVSVNELSTYYYKILAKSEVGETASERTERFTTPPRAPHVNDEGAVEIERTAAKLIGFVNPNGGEVTECYFEWGTTKALEEEPVPCSALPGDGEQAVPVSGELTGLQESTTYFVRLVAVNPEGIGVTGREEFTTLPNAPAVHTESAREVGKSTAKLRGFVNPHGEAITACYFNYGTQRRIYGEKIKCEQTSIEGEQPVEVTAKVTGLKESTTYDFEVAASNGKGEAFGGNAMLRTLPNAPKDNTSNATEITSDSALLHAQVDPYGAEVTVCEFEWGTTEALGEPPVLCKTNPGSGESPVPVSAELTGLSAKKKYYFRIFAENAFGKGFGGISKLTTLEAGLPPIVSRVSPNKGAEAGGTKVKIKGQNFANVVAVKFGSSDAASFETTKVTQIVAVTPPGTPGSVEVTVTTGAGSSAPASGDKFTYK